MIITKQGKYINIMKSYVAFIISELLSSVKEKDSEIYFCIKKYYSLSLNSFLLSDINNVKDKKYSSIFNIDINEKIIKKKLILTIVLQTIV